MKHFFLISFFLFLMLGFANAQSVENIRFEKSGRQIVVYYDLLGEQGTIWSISLFCSPDGGKTWGSALQKITGDAGKKIKPGANKKIIWDVLSEVEKLEGEISFKISAIQDPSTIKPVYSTEYYKFKKGKQDWLIAGLVSSATGALGYLQYDKYYKQYKTATEDAADIHKKVDLYNTVSSAAVMVAGFCAVEFIWKSRKQAKAKKQSLSFYPQPIYHGTGFGLAYFF